MDIWDYLLVVISCLSILLGFVLILRFFTVYPYSSHTAKLRRMAKEQAEKHKKSLPVDTTRPKDKTK